MFAIIIEEDRRTKDEAFGFRCDGAIWTSFGLVAYECLPSMVLVRTRYGTTHHIEREREGVCAVIFVVVKQLSGEYAHDAHDARLLDRRDNLLGFRRSTYAYVLLYYW